MRKAQSVIEYIVAIILFLVVIIYLLNIYFDRLPEEITKIEEQELCSEAESMAYSFLDTAGEPDNWNANGELTRLGFSYYNTSGINYTKWEAAISRGYYNVFNAIKLNRTFNIKYSIYAFNLTDDTTDFAPNTDSPRAFILREASKNRVNISAGSADTQAYLNLTLFFPNSTSVSISACPTGTLEAGETPGGTVRDGGTEVVMNWTIIGGDYDCISLSNLNSKLVYITKAIMENITTKKEYPIYMQNHTKIKQEFGSTEYKTIDKPYCEITRKRMVHNNSLSFPARFNIRTW